MQKLIEVRKLSKYYTTKKGDIVHALDDISFDIMEGEFITVVGPSGCGKTTLLMILGGLLKRTKGDILLRGTQVEGPRPEIGIVFQESVLLPWRNVIGNTLLTAEILGLDMKKSAERAMELLDLVGLKGFEHKYPFELSGGMQQRNAIMRALLHDPAILLMDEPFGALDAMTREQMNLEILRIWSESRKTTFFITHSIPEAVFLADKVIVLTPRPGRIARIIDVRSKLRRPRDLKMIGSDLFGEITQSVRDFFTLSGGID